MEALEFSVVLLTTVLLLTWAARRTGIAEPVALLLGGVALGFVPRLGEVALPPEVVLFLFLPALLYWETLNTSLREIRSNLRVIVLLSVGLVLATAGAVAVAAHALGMPWPAAFVLGAVLAPTDATAVAAVGRGLPRRQLTTLKAESLANDGTALVVFAIAVGVAVEGDRFSPGPAALSFALSYVAGAAAGVAAAGVAVLLRRLFDDRLLQNGVSLLTPLLAYLAAETVHGSGVIAVVVCGFILAHLGPLLVPAPTRLQAEGFWSLTSFVLNGALFVLVGLQIPQAVEAVVERDAWAPGQIVVYAVVTTLVVVATRIGWGFAVTWTIRLLDRRPQQRLRRLGARARFPVSWAGVRGGVSLAAALAVPATTAAGGPFVHREMIVVVTAAVILATVLGLGQTLPAVIRWARLEPDPREHDEEVLARRTVTTAALEALPEEARRFGTPQVVQEAVGAELHAHLEDLDIEDLVDGEEHRARHAEVRLQLALLARKRRALVTLRDRGEIDDMILQRVQRMLDGEEMRLTLRGHYAEPPEDPQDPIDDRVDALDAADALDDPVDDSVDLADPVDDPVENR